MVAAVEGQRADGVAGRVSDVIDEHQVVAAVAVERDRLICDGIVLDIEGIVPAAAVHDQRFVERPAAEGEDVVVVAQGDAQGRLAHVHAGVEQAHIGIGYQPQGHAGEHGRRAQGIIAQQRAEGHQPLIRLLGENLLEGFGDEGQRVGSRAGGIIEDRLVSAVATVHHHQDAQAFQQPVQAQADGIVPAAAIDRDRGGTAAQRVEFLMRTLQVDRVRAAAGVEHNRFHRQVGDLSRAAAREGGLVDRDGDRLVDVVGVGDRDRAGVHAGEGVDVGAGVAVVEEVERVFGEGQPAVDVQPAEDVVERVAAAANVDRIVAIKADPHPERSDQRGRRAAHVKGIVLRAEVDLQPLGGGVEGHRAGDAHAAHRAVLEVAGIGLVVAAVVDDHQVVAGVAGERHRAGDEVHAPQRSRILAEHGGFHAEDVVARAAVRVEVRGAVGAVHVEPVRAAPQVDVGSLGGGEHRTGIGQRGVIDMRFGQTARAHTQAGEAQGGELAAGPLCVGVGGAIGSLAAVVGVERVRAALAVEDHHAVDVRQQIGSVAHVQRVVALAAVNGGRHAGRRVADGECVVPDPQFDVQFFYGGVLQAACRPQGEAGQREAVQHPAVGRRAGVDVQAVFIAAVAVGEAVDGERAGDPAQCSAQAAEGREGIVVNAAGGETALVGIAGQEVFVRAHAAVDGQTPVGFLNEEAVVAGAGVGVSIAG